MISSAIAAGTSSYLANCIVDVARPCVIEAEVRHVPEHLSQRDVGADHLRAAARLHREDAAAAAVQVAHHGPHVLLGRHDLDVHHGFEEDRLALRHASLNAIDAAILKAISDESTSW